MSVIISNTTPINYLVLIDHIAILQHLYTRVTIPQAVSFPLDTSLTWLDVGEREAIQLAKEIRADALIIDEPDGRQEAKRQGLRVIGTLRVLYDAAEAGLCDLVHAYERLQQTTFRAHPQLLKTFLDAQRRQTPGLQGG
jgi:predicted nucleic acid-binding protein